MRAVWIGCVVLLATCGGEESSRPADTVMPTETVSPWPFTVDDVQLSCEGPGRVFVTTLDGSRFAVNGAASAQAPMMDAIQAYYDTRVLIERGLALCASGTKTLHLTAPPRAPSPDTGVPTFTVDASRLGGITASAQSEIVIDGVRAELSLSCERGGAPFVHLNLVRPPPTPPPWGSVFAEFRVDDWAPLRFELAWTGNNSGWTLAEEDDRRMSTRLAHAVLAGRSVTMTSASRYTPSEPITWNIDGFRDQAAEIRRQCGAQD